MPDLWESDALTQFSKVLTDLETAHRTKLTDHEFEAYLKNITAMMTLDQFREAVELSPQICRAFPSIAEIGELAGLDNPKTRAHLGAERVWENVRSGKELHLLAIDSIALKVIAEMGGRGNTPTSFGRWAPDQERFAKKDFLEKYLRYSRHEEAKVVEPVKQVEHTPGTFTREERLKSNRAAFEVMRQARECKSTGKNKWDREKVRLAQLDASKDEEITALYGEKGERQPTPESVFGNVGQSDSGNPPESGQGRPPLPNWQ